MGKKGTAGLNAMLIIVFEELFRVWSVFSYGEIKLITFVELKIFDFPLCRSRLIKNNENKH
jgi:hypothetical protein